TTSHSLLRESMKRMAYGIVVAGLMAAGAPLLIAQGQGQDHAPILIPDSSVENPGEHGVAAHTNHLIRVTPNAVGSAPAGETPASIAAAYNVTGSLVGSDVIAIVDAYHYPTALNDFNVFAAKFGLPTQAST